MNFKLYVYIQCTTIMHAQNKFSMLELHPAVTLGLTTYKSVCRQKESAGEARISSFLK